MYKGNLIENISQNTAAAMDMLFEALASAPKVRCASCEAPKMLKPCPECKLFWCSNPNDSSDCFRWHDCAQVDGANSYDVTRG